MSLLLQPTLAAFRAQCVRLEARAAFHTSSAALGGGPRPKKPKLSARRRLATDLKTKTGKLEVAPKENNKSSSKAKAQSSEPPPIASSSKPIAPTVDLSTLESRNAVLGRSGAPHTEVKAMQGVGEDIRAIEYRRRAERRRKAIKEFLEVDRGSGGKRVARARGKERSGRGGGKTQEKGREEGRGKRKEKGLEVTSKLALREKGLPTRFMSPPLLPGLAESIKDVLGEEAVPTPIQGLSLKHLVSPEGQGKGKGLRSYAEEVDKPWQEYLLASETGSGKSIAYMLPLLQNLKVTETEGKEKPKRGQRLPAINPRAIVLAPTHELARQLSSFAKQLSHVVKLRVLCASRANRPSTRAKAASGASAAKMAQIGEGGEGEGEFEVRPGSAGSLGASGAGAAARPVDVLVTTPMKLLDMVRGHGWNKEEDGEGEGEGEEHQRQKWEEKTHVPEVGLSQVEWVIVDEADVLFDPDFIKETRTLLADVSAARGRPLRSEEEASTSPASEPAPISYPFNLILTSATIPDSLANYLATHHPTLTRLASPNLHRLPSSMRQEVVSTLGGNRDAEVERRIKSVWAEDARARRDKSRILVFCNRNTKVTELAAYLKAKGVASVPMTGASEERHWGNNRHIEAFLKTKTHTNTRGEGSNEADAPYVLITTSLLSRGLDFAPSITHVFILDEPRNEIDFLHRAGRTARAGGSGTVVVFKKSKGGRRERMNEGERDLKKLRA